MHDAPHRARSFAARRARRIACAAIGLAGLGRLARAESVGTVVVDAPRPDAAADVRAREADALPLVTVIDARRATAAQASVADLLAGEAGVRVRSRGGLGAFTAVSVRGSEESEVAVVLDGVPLSRAASGAIDLAQLPADSLDRIEIYRGAPPIELGGEAVGGVIHLISRRAGTRLEVGGELGGGSFGARAASAHLGGPIGKGRGAPTVQLAASYRGATGDFTYFDNGGTLLYRDDDRVSRRHNNDFDQASVDASLDRRGPRPFRVGVHGFWKAQGVPGVATLGRETETARLTTGRLLLTGDVGRRGRVDLRLGSSLLFERSHFENPLGEAAGLFGAAVSEGEAVAASLTPRLDAPLGRHQLLTVLGEARLEHRRPYDLLRPALGLRPAVRGLFALAAADELSLWRERIAIYGGVRLDLRRSALLTGADGGTLPDQDAFDWFLSPRLNVRVRAHRTVTLRASAGRYVRFPTLLEQFGDGAFIVGRPTLRPESAWGGEVAATVRGAGARIAGGVEAALFGRRASGLIAFIPGGNSVTPINVGDARVLGLEARGDVTLGGRLALTASYTFLDARDVTAGSPSEGKRLPGRAAHAADLRATLLGGPFRVAYELDFLSSVPRDAFGLNELPPRLLHALSAGYHARGFELVLEVRNLADTRIVALPLGGSARAGETAPYPLVDFYNFPLPGRAFYATARFTRP